MGVRRGQAFHWNLSGGLGNPNSEGFGEGDVEVDDRGDGWSSKGILVIGLSPSLTGSSAGENA